MENKIIKLEKRDNNIGKWRDTLELVYGYKLAVWTGKEISIPMDVRFYMGHARSASRVYCAIWWSHCDGYSNGSGMAGGYGYDKKSAAMDSALRCSGVTLKTSIAGVGNPAIEGVLTAFAEYCGYKHYQIIRVHA